MTDTEKLKRLTEAVLEYKREYESPVRDYDVFLALRRRQMFHVLICNSRPGAEEEREKIGSKK